MAVTDLEPCARVWGLVNILASDYKSVLGISMVASTVVLIRFCYCVSQNLSEHTTMEIPLPDIVTRQ
eukprot:8248262-Karenia_brevis.AAC.1